MAGKPRARAKLKAPLYNNVTVMVTGPVDDQYVLQVGPEGYVFAIEEVCDIVKGVRKDRDFLLHQIALGLDAAGFDPVGKTPAQLKVAIEALVLKW